MCYKARRANDILAARSPISFFQAGKMRLVQIYTGLLTINR
jgi:hypothetical protein